MQVDVNDIRGDTVSQQMIDTIDSFIAEFEARHWLRAASVGEQLICEIYAALDLPVPAERAMIIEKTLRHDLSRKRMS